MSKFKGTQTHLWQESRGHEYWRIQTEDPTIYRRLAKRKDMRLVGWGINRYIRIFQTKYFSPYEAKRSFRRIVGQKVGKSDATGVFSAITTAIMDTPAVYEP